ncbi:Sodium transporter HKT1, partial [Cucurbita argyrosperma subsp. sororia]
MTSTFFLHLRLRRHSFEHVLSSKKWKFSPTSKLLIITTLMFLGGESLPLRRQLPNLPITTNKPTTTFLTPFEFENESATVDELTISKSSFKVLGRIIIGTVSTFTNCGFIPTNENMIFVFKKNSGLLIILAAEVLLGGCLYPVGLRLVIMAAAKVTGKKGWRYILKNDSAMGYSHLLSGVRCWFLAATAVGFIILQFIIFCSLVKMEQLRRDLGWDESLSYLAIFITLICITERDKLKNDPLNFSVLNIAVEVISAYGNVGFSTGYSCKRQVVADSTCRDAWYGFAGRWSAKGKLILILVMFFGRLKSFSRHGGKAWKLS